MNAMCWGTRPVFITLIQNSWKNDTQFSFIHKDIVKEFTKANIGVHKRKNNTVRENHNFSLVYNIQIYNVA